METAWKVIIVHLLSLRFCFMFTCFSVVCSFLWDLFRRTISDFTNNNGNSYVVARNFHAIRAGLQTEKQWFIKQKEMLAFARFSAPDLSSTLLSTASSFACFRHTFFY